MNGFPLTSTEPPVTFRVADTEGVHFLQWCLPKLRLRWRGFRRVRRHVYRRLEKRMAELGLAELADYRLRLEREPTEWAVLDTICRIPLTRFYRDRVVFEHLERVVLPELGRMAMARGDTEMRGWSLGCASGEEPYTVAIVWRLAVAPRFSRLTLRIVATDCDREAIERARRGCYPAHSLRDLPHPMRAAAFRESSAGLVVEDGYRIGVDFQVQDVRTRMPDGPFHLILCRNVVFTYFDEELQRQILPRVARRLVSGGALVIGASESLPERPEGLEPWPGGHTVYRRLPEATD